MIDWDGAKIYRTELRRAINMHKGTGKHCRPATMRERWGRLCKRCERDWSPATAEAMADFAFVDRVLIEEWIERLVAHRYPGCGQPPRLDLPEEETP